MKVWVLFSMQDFCINSFFKAWYYITNSGIVFFPLSSRCHIYTFGSCGIMLVSGKRMPYDWRHFILKILLINVQPSNIQLIPASNRRKLPYSHFQFSDTASNQINIRYLLKYLPALLGTFIIFPLTANDEKISSYYKHINQAKHYL